jgi:hypothetical protein
MPSTAHGAGDQAFVDPSRIPAADCAYLHSAFGPGCPYCGEAAAPAGSGDPTGSSSHQRPDRDLGLGAVA